MLSEGDRFCLPAFLLLVEQLIQCFAEVSSKVFMLP